MNNKNQLDRGSEDYNHLFSQYMKRGARSMTDTEIRALSETSGGTVLFPTIYANKFNEMLGDDAVYSQVSKMIVNSSTVRAHAVRWAASMCRRILVKRAR